MSAAIKFEREAPLRTVEIDNESSNNLLTPKLETQDPSISEELPSGRLCGRRLSTKASSEREFARIDGRVSRYMKRRCGGAHIFYYRRVAARSCVLTNEFSCQHVPTCGYVAVQ